MVKLYKNIFFPVVLACLAISCREKREQLQVDEPVSVETADSLSADTLSQ